MTRKKVGNLYYKIAIKFFKSKALAHQPPLTPSSNKITITLATITVPLTLFAALDSNSERAWVSFEGKFCILTKKSLLIRPLRRWWVLGTPNQDELMTNLR